MGFRKWFIKNLPRFFREGVKVSDIEYWTLDISPAMGFYVKLDSHAVFIPCQSVEDCGTSPETSELQRSGWARATLQRPDSALLQWRPCQWCTACLIRYESQLTPLSLLGLPRQSLHRMITLTFGQLYFCLSIYHFITPVSLALCLHLVGGYSTDSTILEHNLQSHKRQLWSLWRLLPSWQVAESGHYGLAFAVVSLSLVCCIIIPVSVLLYPLWCTCRLCHTYPIEILFYGTHYCLVISYSSHIYINGKDTLWSQSNNYHSSQLRMLTNEDPKLYVGH